MKNLIKTQSGRSMVEMLGVLAIIGVLSVGGIAGYTMAMEKYRTNKAIEAVQLLSTEVRTLFSGQGNYADVDDLTAVGTDKDGNATDGQAWVNNIIGEAPFGKITLAEATPTGGAAGDGFSITMTEVPAASCVTMGTADWGASSVTVGGVAVTSVSTAQTNCDTDSETLVWVFE